MAGNILQTHKKAFRDLLLMDAVRGVHSTGVASNNYVKGEMKVVKDVGLPDTLFDLYVDFDNKGNWKDPSNMLMGHNRQATIGEVNQKNSHPFLKEKWVGAHNGSLNYGYKRLLPEADDFEVDSEALINYIDKSSIKEAIPKTDGAYALTLYDMENKQLNFIRNKDRPLVYAFTEDGCLVWASEGWMIWAALTRRGIKWDKKIYEFKVDTHYQIDLPNGGRVTKDSLKKVEEVKGYETPNNFYQNWQRGRGYSYSYGKRVEDKKETGGKSSGSQTSRKGSKKQNLSTLKQQLKGTEIEFYTNKWEESKTGQKFASGYLQFEDIQIRIYAHGTPFEKLVSSYSTKFKGIIRNVKKERGQVYVTIKLETIRKVFAEGYTPTFFRHFGNTWIPLHEWKEKADCCAWCGTTADPKESSDYVWIDDKEYVCGDCKGTKDVAQLISHHV